MAAIDASKSIAYGHKQSKISHLNNMMGMRSCTSGRSLSGKGVVAQSMISKQFRGCWERIYVMSPTCKIDQSTWGRFQIIFRMIWGGDLKKEPAFYTEWDPAVIQKLSMTTRRLLNGKRRKDISRFREFFGSLIILRMTRQLCTREGTIF